MAKEGSTIEKVKDFWNSQVNDDQNWDLNAKLLRAVGLFAGSIFFMRNFGELMAV